MPGRGTWSTATAIAALAVVAVTGGCSGSDKPNKYGLANAGTINSALTAGGAPFASTGPDGKPTGLLIELNNIIAARLGVKITYKTTDLNGAFTGITSNKYDVLSVGLVATPERAKSVTFTKPIYIGANAVIVRTDSTVTGIPDLTGKRVGAGANSNQYDFAQASLKNAKLVSEPTNSAAIAQLGAKNLDAIVVGGTQAATLMNTSPGKFKLAFSVQQTSPGAVALNKHETKFQQAYNAQLSALFADGTYLKLYDKYCGPLKLPFPTGLYKYWPQLQQQVASDPSAQPTPSSGK